MILPAIYVGRNRNRKESEFFFTDSDSKPWTPITLLSMTASFHCFLINWLCCMLEVNEIDFFYRDLDLIFNSDLDWPLPRWPWPSRWGLKPKMHALQTQPTVSPVLVSHIQRGDIKIKPNILVSSALTIIGSWSLRSYRSGLWALQPPLQLAEFGEKCKHSHIAHFTFSHPPCFFFLLVNVFPTWDTIEQDSRT